MYLQSFIHEWVIHLILLPFLRFLLPVCHFVNPLHGLTNVFLTECVVYNTSGEQERAKAKEER